VERKSRSDIAQLGGRWSKPWNRSATRKHAAGYNNKIKNRIGYRKISDDPGIQIRADAGRTRHLQKEIENFT
jgi:hypothetical protein